MATIVYQKDKRSGITYAYESVSYWDKEKDERSKKSPLLQKEGQFLRFKQPESSMAPLIYSMPSEKNWALPKT